MNINWLHTQYYTYLCVHCLKKPHSYIQTPGLIVQDRMFASNTFDALTVMPFNNLTRAALA